MVLSHFANKFGLWDIIAPNKVKKSKRQKQQHDEEARQFQLQKQQQEKDKYQKLKIQYEIEQKAEKEMNDTFAKKQRVSYYVKADDIWIDAVVVGVHFDDGPDKPYYTIRYKKEFTEIDNGPIRTNSIVIEKQTNADRLKRLPWDEDKTWEIIKS